MVRIAVEKLLECGVRVTNVTCDGPPVQLAAMRLLGAIIDPSKPVCTRILSDLDCHPIYFVLDAVHCFKLIRNAWFSCKVFLNSNKLTKAHVNFKNSNLKVYLAVQVFSRSVAASLRLCREGLKLPAFAGSQSTEEFLLNLKGLFDLFNSHTGKTNQIFGIMGHSNKPLWLPFMGKITNYLMELKNLQGQKIVLTQKKTGFVGMICNAYSLEQIFSQNVERVTSNI